MGIVVRAGSVHTLASTVAWASGSALFYMASPKHGKLVGAECVFVPVIDVHIDLLCRGGRDGERHTCNRAPAAVALLLYAPPAQIGWSLEVKGSIFLPRAASMACIRLYSRYHVA